MAAKRVNGRVRPTSHRVLFALVLVATLAASGVEAQQEPPAPQLVSTGELQSAVEHLGDLDYATRTDAGRLVRRTAPAQAVPALLKAVADHRDGYVRYRALVLLTGFNDSRTHDVMREALRSPNDRLRTVAYSYFEHAPDRSMIPELITALDKETAEFVRPALIRALAALGSDARVQPILTREAGRGEDFFRSAVIEALGDYQAGYAFQTLTVTATLDGPLRDDAVVALGKIGDKRAMETLASVQRVVSRADQPAIAAAICLLGSNCDLHQNYLIETLKFAEANQGYQELLRSVTAALGTLGTAGHRESIQALMDIGAPSQDPTRARVALALATVALRNTAGFLPLLQQQSKRSEVIDLLAEGFDMLEEDLDKERFFAIVRRTYWDAAQPAAVRMLMQTLIAKLDF
jgi:HEAT repeat protein